MAQTTQIVPKFSFPYVETVINNNTVVTDDDVNTNDDSIKYLFVFTSSQGPVNKFVQRIGTSNFEKTFGKMNYKKYGQPLMMPPAVLEKPNTKVWCMRVMPENATISNKIFSSYFKADTADDVEEPSKRKFRIKFSQRSVENITNVSQLNEEYKVLDGETIRQDGQDVYLDNENYQQVPLGYMNYNGSGDCGDKFRLRVSQNMTYEKEYGIKMYTFEVLTTTGGLHKVTEYVGCTVTSSKYDEVTFINDILEDASIADVPINLFIDEEQIEVVYNAFIDFCNQQYIELQEEYAEKLEEYDIPEGMLNNTEAITEEYREQVAEMKKIRSLITLTKPSNLPDIDEFDIFFGLDVASSEMNPLIAFPEELTDDIDTEAEDFNSLEYTTSTNMPQFNISTGITMIGGTNGYFDEPRTTFDEEGDAVKWTYEDEVEDCYNKAFNGTYDKKILSTRRTPVSAFFDANYPFSTKYEMAELAKTRGDCLCYLDTGLIKSFSNSSLNSLISDYSIFDNWLISKNTHGYTVREPSTKKRIDVTITYLLAPLYATHMQDIGEQIPFVKNYCQLTGHVKDSLFPVIEEYDSEVKDLLYKNRINYFKVVEDNVFQRATQNTSDMDISDMQEESNVTMAYHVKRMIEYDIESNFYNFADGAVRRQFKEVEEAKFEGWNGEKIQSIEIEFKANKWEAERSIIHCYVSIVFRGLMKQAILELNINPRDYSSDLDDDEDME